MDSTFQLTVRRRDALGFVRSELVQRDLEQGYWLINGNPAKRWYGRTFFELERAGLIEVTRMAPVADTILTDAGRTALTG